jgi:hypothetical protein
MRRALTATRATVRGETALAALGLALLAALLYGDHVVRGGFVWDDWENAGTTRFGGGHDFIGPFDLRQAAYRPVLQLLLPLPHLVFGAHPAPHLALALLLAVGAAAAFHALLRALGAPPAVALSAAALTLAFPWSSSTRLWATASLNLVAVMLVLAAGTISLRAVAQRHAGGGGNTAWGSRAALTAALCAAGVLTYEAVAGLVLLLPLLYRVHAPWRAALARWRPEALAAAGAAVWVALATTKPEHAGGTALDHAAAIARDGAALVGRSVLPVDGVPPAAGVAFAVAIAAAALVLNRPAARAPAIAAGLSLAALALAWAPFVPGEAKYVPGAPGIYDRVNLVAGFALAALVCSLATLAATLLPARARRRATGAMLALVAAGWVVAVRGDVSDYARAAAAQDGELAAVDAALRDRAARGTIVVLLHEQTWAAPGVPTFGQPWDLSPALRLRYSDASLSGFPVAAGDGVTCAAHELRVVARGGDDPPPAPYARAVLVDARSGRSARVSDARGCAAALATARRKPRTP